MSKENIMIAHMHIAKARGDRGGDKKPLGESYLGRWLSLVRIQSFPVSVIIVCAGYLTVAETIFTISIWPLLAVGVVSHAAYYAMNDLYDREEDRKYKDESKPLVSGDIKVRDAVIGIYTMLIASLVIAFEFLVLPSFVMFTSACLMGYVYNKRSKADWFSAFYLFVWALFMVMVGALQAGEVNNTTILFGVIAGLQMAMFTFLGDIKDYNANEPSIPRKMGLNVDKDTDEIRQDIVIYTVSSTLAIGAIFSLYAPLLDLMVMCVGGIVWGLFWQRLLYGSALYFP